MFGAGAIFESRDAICRLVELGLRVSLSDGRGVEEIVREGATILPRLLRAPLFLKYPVAVFETKL